MKKLNDWTRYVLLRIKLEKLKQKTWSLVILAKVLVFLVILATYCLSRA